LASEEALCHIIRSPAHAANPLTSKPLGQAWEKPMLGNQYGTMTAVSKGMFEVAAG